MTKEEIHEIWECINNGAEVAILVVEGDGFTTVAAKGEPQNMMMLLAKQLRDMSQGAGLEPDELMALLHAMIKMIGSTQEVSEVENDAEE